MLSLPEMYIAQPHCLSVPLPSVDFMDVTIGDVPD